MMLNTLVTKDDPDLFSHFNNSQAFVYFAINHTHRVLLADGHSGCLLLSTDICHFLKWEPHKISYSHDWLIPFLNTVCIFPFIVYLMTTLTLTVYLRASEK